MEAAGANCRQPAITTSLIIRTATADDALCLSVLGTQVFLDTYARTGIRPSIAREVTRAFSPAAFDEWMADPAAGIEVAESDGHLVGFHQVRFRATNALAPHGVHAELSRLYVQAPFAGRGVGTALLQSAEQMVLRRHATMMWLKSWVHNDRALRFYAARGYDDIGATLYEFEGEAHENRVLARSLSGTPSDFTFRKRKNGDVEVLHHGAVAVTLRGNKALEFLDEASECDNASVQALMARVTGNYKHGNERLAKAHPRNSG